MVGHCEKLSYRGAPKTISILLIICFAEYCELFPTCAGGANDKLATDQNLAEVIFLI